MAKTYISLVNLAKAMDEYINSCRIKSQVRLRCEGSDYMEDIKDLNGKVSYTWIKAPSVAGLCLYANIDRKTYYKYRKLPGYNDVCRQFERACDEADMDCQYNKESSNGARWRLQLRGYETDKEKQERLVLEQALKMRQEKHDAEMRTINIKNRLLELQLDKAKNTGEVDPLITQLIQEIGWGGDNDK